jgi:hypothetical protein
VTWPDWLRLNAAETARGKAAGRPRVKAVEGEEIRRLLGR